MNAAVIDTNVLIDCFQRAGGAEHVKVARVVNIVRAMKELQEAGAWLRVAQRRRRRRRRSIRDHSPAEWSMPHLSCLKWI